MSILRRIASAIVILGFLPLWGGSTFPFLWRAYPQTRGSLTVPGLQEAVQVRRDDWGIPHIDARNEYDLFFAQGYVHAQDRLWQMDYHRRIGAGRLAEILGAEALPADRWMRTLGLRRAAEREWQALPAAAQGVQQAYSAGVNAFIAQSPDRLPMEFSLLKYIPEPWTPIDSLAIGKVVALAWDSNWEDTLFRGELFAALGGRAQELTGSATLAPELQDLSYDVALLADWRAAQPWLGAWGRGVGSSAWVVDGSMTASGKPLLASDVQLQPAMPSPWYEVQLTAGALDVVGASIPGLPGVWMGHNQRIAWSVVNGTPDVQDMYVERVNPQNADEYEFKGQWQAMDVRTEDVRVRGQSEPLQLRVRATRHGPILSAPVQGTVLSLRWGGLEERGFFAALDALYRAQDWQQFREAASHWAAPAVGLVYADVEGNIGAQYVGNVPLRQGQGATPVPGWTGEYEWAAHVSAAEFRVLNPDARYILSADALSIPGQGLQPVAGEYGAPFRAQRIEQRLTGASGLTVETCRGIQADTYSIPAVAIAEYVLAMPAEGWLWERAVNFLRGWNGVIEISSGAAALSELAYRCLLANTFADEIWPRQVAEERWDAASDLLARILSDENSVWFDDVRTAQRENRTDMLSKSLHEAMDFWGNHRGDLVGNKDSQWGWGQEHTVSFVHPVAVTVPWLGVLLSHNNILARGSWDTIDVAEWEPSHLKVQRATSWRQILDTADWENSRAGHTSGQSGHPLHRHYADMLADWQAVRPHLQCYSREAVEARTESLLQLLP